MQAYDLSRLKDDLRGWMNNRFLQPIVYVEGGWEYWMQIDFPCWLDITTGQQWDFRREFPVGDARLDWAVNTETDTAGVPTAVELKCQTHKGATDTFLAAVGRDLTKLKALPPGFIVKRMIAAVIDSSAQKALEAQAFRSIYNHNNIVDFMMFDC